MALPDFPGGIPIVVSEQLPIPPSELEDVRRRVRHGLADVIEWCGDEVGPKPGEPTHAYVLDLPVSGPRVIVSQELHDRIRESL